MTDQVADAGAVQPTGETAASTPVGAAAQATSLLGGEVPAADAGQETQSENPESVQQAEADQAGSEDAAEEGEKPEGAPEFYEFKAPEGVVLDEAVMGEFSTVAKELGLTQDAAQAVVEKLAPKIAERNAQAQAEAVAAYRAELVIQVKADKEIGGEKLNEKLAVADKALAAFGTPALRALLNTSGLGDHPEIIRAFYRAGKAISEDSFVPGGTKPSKAELSVASRLYG